MASKGTSCLGLADRPLRRQVTNRSKDLGSRNCEEKLVLPERCSIRLSTFGGIQTFVSKGTNVFRFVRGRKPPLTIARAKGALTASQRVALPCCQDSDT